MIESKKMNSRETIDGVIHRGPLVALLETILDGSTTIAVVEGKLPRQVDSGEGDSWGAVGLGRKASGGTRPRLSWGRCVL